MTVFGHLRREGRGPQGEQEAERGVGGWQHSSPITFPKVLAISLALPKPRVHILQVRVDKMKK